MDEPPRSAQTTEANGAAALIRLTDVRLCLGGEDIYESLSFTVARGELLCILGPSGCGKSTLLRLIGDLVQPEAGEITIAGEPPARAWERIAAAGSMAHGAGQRDARPRASLRRQARRGRA